MPETMEYRTLDLTINSANDLKEVSFFSNMQTYVVVSIHDSSNHKPKKPSEDDPTKTRVDKLSNFSMQFLKPSRKALTQQTPVDKDRKKSKRQTQKTRVDKQGNTNPKWEFPMQFTVGDEALQNNRLTLVCRIYAHHMVLPDELVGEVRVPLSDIFWSDVKAKETGESCQVLRKKSGEAQGVLRLSHRFGDRFTPPPSSGVKKDKMYWLWRKKKSQQRHEAEGDAASSNMGSGMEAIGMRSTSTRGDGLLESEEDNKIVKEDDDRESIEYDEAEYSETLFDVAKYDYEDDNDDGDAGALVNLNLNLLDESLLHEEGNLHLLEPTYRSHAVGLVQNLSYI